MDLRLLSSPGLRTSTQRTAWRSEQGRRWGAARGEADPSPIRLPIPTSRPESERQAPQKEPSDRTPDSSDPCHTVRLLLHAPSHCPRAVLGQGKGWADQLGSLVMSRRSKE